MTPEPLRLAVETTRSNEHLRLIETFVLKSARGEAVLQLIRRAEEKRVDPSGLGMLFARDAAKARALLEDLGHPALPQVGPLARYAFLVLLHDSGVAADHTPWREFKLKVRHGGAADDALFKVQGATAELTASEPFWHVAQLALGSGVAERAAAPEGVSVSRPELLRGADGLRLVGGHEQLIGIDPKSAVFWWTDLSKKPKRVVNLGHTVMSANAWAGWLVACGVAHDTGVWRVVRVRLAKPSVEVVVESSDTFLFFDAKLLLSDDGERLAVAYGEELRVFAGREQVGAVRCGAEVSPALWSGETLILRAAGGLVRWRPGAASSVEPLTESVVHRCGPYELEPFADGTLRVGARVFTPSVEADRTCVRRLMHSRPRLLAGRALLFQSDRLVALDLETLDTWLVLEGADTQPFALLGGKTLVVDQQASGRPKVVEVVSTR
ncbi:MAG: hypothetical protein JNK82_20695 [Myxococcaceae bacterium]|nr:hypothetical protein [Myxococcaceae bacterium]